MRRLSLTLGLALLSVCCGGSPPVSQTPATASSPAAPAPPGAIPAGDDSGDWVRPAKDFASTRFSALDQITPDSVKQLTVKATFSTGYVRGHEAAPLIAGNTMYVVTPFPNVMYALDLTQPGAPLKWKYEPKPMAAAQGVACCDVVNRGAVYDNGTIFY